MIPYIHIPTIVFGPITLQVWGLMVSLGILVSLFLAKKILGGGVRGERLTSLAFWIVLGSFAGARIFHIVFYEPQFFFANPLEIFKIWHGGFSSFGGFAGATVSSFVYFKKYHFDYPRYANAIIFAFPWGWAIGRIGCFFSHLHPGRFTNSFLGVRYPEGTRFDLGLIEILNGLGMGLVMLIAKRFHPAGDQSTALKAKDAAVSAVGLFWYGTFRFFTDFLRATGIPGADARYWGLTPAQYGSILIWLAAIFILFRSSRARA